MDLKIVAWAADECNRQKSGELSVVRLCEAWVYLTDLPDKTITPEMVKILGHLVDPHQNRNGHRTIPVHFTSGEVISASNIEYQIDNLCEYSNVLTPTQWYTEFEKIHPFIDGNGRVGSLLFNLLNGSLYNPVVPPEVFYVASPPCI